MEAIPKVSKKPLLITVGLAICLGLLLHFAFTKSRDSYRIHNMSNAAASESVEQKSLGFQEAFSKGEALYLENCATCHGAMGQGNGPTPPHNDPTWLTDERLTHIIHFGLQGEIEVSGKVYNSVMPPVAPSWEAEKIAKLMTFVQNHFGEKQKQLVTPERVAQLQQMLSQRNGNQAMTAPELKALPVVSSEDE